MGDIIHGFAEGVGLAVALVSFVGLLVMTAIIASRDRGCSHQRGADGYCARCHERMYP